jgi:hypothetical protein
MTHQLIDIQAKYFMQAFLPLFTIVAEAMGPLSLLSRSQYASLNKRQAQSSLPSKSQIVLAFLALVWPLFVISSEESSIIATGTICPIGWRWERLIPLIQLLNGILDAAIISHTSLLARAAKDDEVDIAAFLSKLSFVAAGSILLFSFPSWLSDSEFIMAFRFRALENREFGIDGVLAAIGIFCSISLLSSLHPACLALLVTTATFFGLTDISSERYLGSAILIL